MRLSRVDFSPLIHHTLVALLNGSSLSDWLAHCKDRAPSPLRGGGVVITGLPESRSQRPLLEVPRLARSDIYRGCQETLYTGCSCSDA